MLFLSSPIGKRCSVLKAVGHWSLRMYYTGMTLMGSHGRAGPGNLLTNDPRPLGRFSLKTLRAYRRASGTFWGTVNFFSEHKCERPLLHCHGPRHRGALFIVPQGVGRLGAAVQSALHHMLFMTRSQKSQAGAPAFGTCSVSGRRRWAPDLHGWARRSRDVHRRQANELPAHQI